MPIISPPLFSIKDLNIQVRLETCVDNVGIDFTGKKSYNFGLFREGIGFGITDINIVVTPSLQPLVEISFKDLYGNTLFGTQRVGGSLLNNQGGTNQSTAIDYSVLYNWPPPKFYFTFKGYLGKSVTWILNMKKLTTGYDSLDASYTLKATFVSNQWGFFADIPFLYLLAVKGLKKQGTTSTGDPNSSIQSIFDYIKTGKKIDVKKIEYTKDFDGLQRQVSSVQANVINAISSSKTVIPGKVVKGEVNGSSINGFANFGVVLPAWLTPDEVRVQSANSDTLQKLNSFLLNKCFFVSTGSTINFIANTDSTINLAAYQNYKYKQVDPTKPDPQVTQNINNVNSKLTQLRKNLTLIDQAIQQKFYIGTKSELSKITISEVFKRLAGDSAYILGKILSAGIKGYSNNSDIRNSPDISSKIIGNAFPLTYLSDDQHAEEVPATTENLGGLDIGVDNNEMQFVLDFIAAISEGISENSQFDNPSTTGSDDAILKTRVNNLEILQGNPYAADYKNIASNVLLRSAIISYFTRSNDPNRPGDYGNSLLFDNDSDTNISELSTKDIDNLGTSKIASLNDNDQFSLKLFCNFFLNLFNSDGSINPNASSTPQTVPSLPGDETVQLIQTNINSSGQLTASPVSDLMRYNVLLSSGGQTGTDQVTTVFDFFINKMVPILQSSNPEMTKSKLFLENGIANRFYNNNLPWLFPNDANDKYSMLLFEGDDASNILSKNSAPTDTEYQGLSANEKDNPNIPIKLGHDEPLGIVSIDSYNDSSGKKLGRVSILQSYINSDAVVSYNKMKANPLDDVAFYDSGQYQVLDPIYKYDNTAFLENYTYDQDPALTTRINPFNIVADNQSANENQLPAQGIAYTIFTHNDSSNTAWGMFLDTTAGRNQRISIYTMCQAILNQMTTLEQQKSVVIGGVLANANEEQNSIYKQFHNIYHQWNLLAYQELDSYSPGGANNICGVQYTNQDLGQTLEQEFTDFHDNANYSNMQTDGQQPPNSAFIYDYPLNSVKGSGFEVDVKNSIINIDALYKPDANTTVLNIIQQICQKNNFMFIPFPGNGTNDVTDIYTPNPVNTKIAIRNYFYVMFLPSAESRVYGNNNVTPKGLMQQEVNPENFQVSAVEVKFGSVDNMVFKGLNVNLDDNKPTAESIVNLQRLVSNENNNKSVTRDSSMLPVTEGRSYTASLDMLGNAQIYPMQYFYIRKSPIFGGLYQIMKVEHAITPNNMTTKVEGVRLAFSTGSGYGGISPVTLGSLSMVNVLSELNLPPGATSGPIASNITQQISPNSLFSNTEGFNPYGGNVTLDITKLAGSIPNSVYDQLDFVISRYGINTTLTMSHFLAQTAHESGNFTMTTENLNYTNASRLQSVFPGYFPGNTANNYVGNPQAIGNHVYANRNGNGNEASGDGFKFRGRGYLQLTGKANYIAFGKSALIDLVANPNLVATSYPLISAGWFFNQNGITGIAAQGSDVNTITSVTLKVNGGTNGLQDRINQFNKFYKILNS